MMNMAPGPETVFSRPCCATNGSLAVATWRKRKTIYKECKRCLIAWGPERVFLTYFKECTCGWVRRLMMYPEFIPDGSPDDMLNAYLARRS